MKIFLWIPAAIMVFLIGISLIIFQDSSPPEKSTPIQDEIEDETLTSDVVFEDELQPQMDDIINDFDDIWQSNWKDAFASHNQGTITEAELYEHIGTVQDEYSDLIDTIETLPEPSSFSTGEISDVQHFKEQFILACTQRQEAASMMLSMLNQRNYSDQSISNVEDTVALGDEYLLDAIGSYLDLCKTFDVSSSF